MGLDVFSESHDQTIILRFVGAINEDSNLDKINVSGGRNIVMDVEGVDAINSFGSRNWCRWIKSVTETQIEIINCNPLFIDYVNTMKDFIPANCLIRSFIVPYYCEKCDCQTLRKFESRDICNDNGKIPEDIPCEKCSTEAGADITLPRFLKFLGMK